MRRSGRGGEEDHLVAERLGVVLAEREGDRLLDAAREVVDADRLDGRRLEARREVALRHGRILARREGDHQRIDGGFRYPPAVTDVGPQGMARPGYGPSVQRTARKL